MKKYNIFHPASTACNHDCRGDINFVRVAIIRAESLEHAFQLAQNDFNEEYADLGIRSTSVGDLIQRKGSEFNMVMPSGFEPLEQANILSEYSI